MPCVTVGISEPVCERNAETRLLFLHPPPNSGIRKKKFWVPAGEKELCSQNLGVLGFLWDTESSMCQPGKVVPGPFQGLSSLKGAEDPGVGWRVTSGHLLGRSSHCQSLFVAGHSGKCFGAKSKKAKQLTSPLGLLGMGAVWAGPGLEQASQTRVWEGLSA